MNYILFNVGLWIFTAIIFKMGSIYGKDKEWTRAFLSRLKKVND